MYRAIIEEAHTHNKPVAVHGMTLADAKILARAGVEG
jgi:imidazolonepropionase-like amidohydrolase